MHYSFEDRDNLYLVVDLMSGGDLRYHIGKHRRFSEEQTSKIFEIYFMFLTGSNCCRILYRLHAALSRVSP